MRYVVVSRAAAEEGPPIDPRVPLTIFLALLQSTMDWTSRVASDQSKLSPLHRVHFLTDLLVITTPKGPDPS